MITYVVLGAILILVVLIVLNGIIDTAFQFIDQFVKEHFTKSTQKEGTRV
ncbi:hypothetical protein H8705_02845 [Oscillospiraceae bacterium NSJ-64]|uniref:Uncharacterized protein n=1 Tax=Youxingia wuxianensis TaxID=2763678 RepID=A0A926EM97_9FIRM|nr:hypothetical protein [Youxingia wuxianensis]